MATRGRRSCIRLRFLEQTTPTVRPELLEPGVVPFRIAGKAPKCFFALLKAFLGVQAMGRSGTADEVDHHLRISPTFARACGFTQPRPDGKYRQSDIPSHRKLQQFEQIMAARGLWAAVKVQTVGDNIRGGIVEIKGQDLAQDTTHYLAYLSDGCHRDSAGAGPAGQGQGRCH